jgi:diketogulonate reductase-like aldo/keto reductase
MLQRIIPSTKEALPVIGLGTWQSFDVPLSGSHDALSRVLEVLHSSGGTVIDSSPMYGRSEDVIGHLTQRSSIADKFFYATKVWTQGRDAGIDQMKASMTKMKRNVMDLMQIHNLVDWKIHIKTLREWKEKGIIRYIGITHYTDAMHSELEKIIRTEDIDFVQFNFSIFARNAEKSLLPAAADRGVATIINRPFGEGSLFSKVKDKSVPAWAREYGIDTWSQFFLKYIISHPAVTCVIPATSNPQHMADNVKAGEGLMPDESLRKKMIDFFQA